MDKPRHANFIGLDGYNMSYKYISPRPSVFRRVNLVSSFYIHDRFLKCEIVPEFSAGRPCIRSSSITDFADGVFHCSHLVGISQLPYRPNRLILFRTSSELENGSTITPISAQTTCSHVLQNRLDHFNSPIRATGSILIVFKGLSKEYKMKRHPFLNFIL